ncbi:hypothetical protein BS78_03G235900 [Paspalum vaginatum]|nr:hypothetical protein BS78_03G235900 [Paspalum vaginatum]
MGNLKNEREPRASQAPAAVLRPVLRAPALILLCTVMDTAMAPDQQQLPTGASSSSPRLRVLNTTLVRPSLSLPETSLPLTFFDIFWLHSPPVERLLFYRLAPDADVATIVSNLKDSLQKAVEAFYPLSGRLRLAPGTSNRYELYYRPGDAVTFTVAECEDDVDIDDLVTDEPREVSKIAALVGCGLRAAGCSLCRRRCSPRAAASPSESPCIMPPATARGRRTSCTPGRPHTAARKRRRRLLSSTGLSSPTTRGACTTSSCRRRPALMRWSSSRCPTTGSSLRSLCPRTTCSASRTSSPTRPRGEALRRRGAPLWWPPLPSSGRATSEPKRAAEPETAR